MLVQVYTLFWKAVYLQSWVSSYSTTRYLGWYNVRQEYGFFILVIISWIDVELHLYWTIINIFGLLLQFSFMRVDLDQSLLGMSALYITSIVIPRICWKLDCNELGICKVKSWRDESWTDILFIFLCLILSSWDILKL